MMGVALCDDMWTILQANGTLCGLIGVASTKELESVSMLSLVHAADAPVIEDAMSHLAALRDLSGDKAEVPLHPASPPPPPPPRAPGAGYCSHTVQIRT